ncbi:TetR family transcriptional regulator [Brenneria populi]|uniref:TetR family transcriptional regulator n=1 Tax=Brenneria populi TaxID=1505588 RepID=A0ABU6JN87_9GAMM|nr:TetR family transcriptional regulator [Brenneria populi Li et al. 2015]
MTNERRRTWQQDPHRKRHILQATLDSIALNGVSGTTYRKIAEISGIPLGSLTYHFANMQELLLEAFRSLAQDVSANFTETIRKADTKEEACRAIVEIVFATTTSGDRTSQLSYELYSFACRTPVMKSVMEGWMRSSRRALEPHFSPLAAVALDALIEGVILHRSVIPVSREDVHKMVVQLANL